MTTPESPTPPDSLPSCGGCGGPHLFDTSVPSVIWNQVIRAQGLSEYLCASCIIRAFAAAGVSFTAELYSAEHHLHGTRLEVRINSQEANVAAQIQDENNALRWKLHETMQALAQRDADREADRAADVARMQTVCDHHRRMALRFAESRHELKQEVRRLRRAQEERGDDRPAV